MDSKIFSMIGLACKAGRVVSGEDGIRNQMKNNKVKLLIIAEDASENSIKRFVNASKYYDIQHIFFGNKEMLGKHIGKQNRAVIGITDDGFKNNILKLIESKN